MSRMQQVLFVRFCVASAELIKAKLTKKQTICMFKECLKIAEYYGDISIKKNVCFKLTDLSDDNKKIWYLKEVLANTKENEDKVAQLNANSLLCITYHYNLKNHTEALVHTKKCVEIAKEIGFEVFELSSYLMQAKIHQKLNQFEETILNCKKCIDMAKKTGAQQSEMNAYLVLSQAYLSLDQFSNVILYSEKGIEIAKKICDGQAAMTACLLLGSAYHFQNRYSDAILYAKKSMDIAKEIDNKESEMDAYIVLINTHYSLRKYRDVISYCKKSLEVSKQTAENSLKTINALLVLGKTHLRLKQYDDAILNCNRCIEMSKKTGNKETEMMACDIKGQVYIFMKQYGKAVLMLKEFLDAAKDTGNQKAELGAYLSIGNSCIFLKRHREAIFYGKLCIEKSKEFGDKQFEADAYTFMANVHHTLNKCDDAVSYERKSMDLLSKINKGISIQKEYVFSGDAYIDFLQQNEIPISFLHCKHGIKQYLEKNGGLIFLLNKLDICFFQLDRATSVAAEEAAAAAASNNIEKGKLELMFNSLVLYVIQIGSSQEIASLLSVDSACEDNTNSYQTLVQYLRNTTFSSRTRKTMFVYLILYGYHKARSEYEQAIDCLEKVMKLELGAFHFLINALCHSQLFELYKKMKEYDKVVSHLHLGLSYASQCHYKLYGFVLFAHKGQLETLGGNLDSAKYFLREAMLCSESIFDSLRQASEHFAIKYFDQLSSGHKDLTEALIRTNQISEALQVLDRSRARELKEALVLKYRMKGMLREKEDLQHSDFKSLVATKSFSVLSYFVYSDYLHVFVVEDTHGIQIATRNVDKCREHLMVLVQKCLDEIHVQQAVNCENRSLDTTIQNISSQTCGENGLREGRGDSEKESSLFHLQGNPTESTDLEVRSALEVLYQELLADISLEHDEIVIIPDGPLFLVPYSALRNPDNGQYLSETKRLRIVPSITTLKLLHQSRLDHPSTKGALIIGDPFVGEVMYLGDRKEFPPLPFAAAEARVIASILGVKPITGRQATKSAVIEALKQNTAIIHIAAHGSLENATIALSPSTENTTGKTIPEEEYYMLTMSDIQEAQVRAQLVVLSCCHSGRGEIRVEGVVGMCRAFLASGARAVVGSLWAISDDATLDFMSRFYSNLKQGKSASTSLQQTIHYMLKSYEYSDPMYWAPFFLLGDDVTVKI